MKKMKLLSYLFVTIINNNLLFSPTNKHQCFVFFLGIQHVNRSQHFSFFKNLLYNLRHKKNESFFLWTSIQYKCHDRKCYPYFSYLQTHTDETQVKQRIRHTHLFAPFNRLSVFPFLSTSSSLLPFTHLLSFSSPSNLIFPLPPTPSFTSSVSPLNVSFSLPHLFFQINICWLACYSNNLLHPARSTDTQRQSACLDSQ